MHANDSPDQSRPPRTLFARHPRVPSLGVDRLSVGRPMRKPIVSALLAGLADNPGVISAAGQDEGDVGAVN